MEVNVKDFGAIGDGICDDTLAIQKAIDYCSEIKGRVIFPPGIYLCKPIKLLSNVEIVISYGATIKATNNFNDYSAIGYKHNEWGDVKSSSMH